MDYKVLMEEAEKVSTKAYAPYSNFSVGACILTSSGKTYTGCNFENSSFGLTICAERNAAGSAIADGERNFKAIAIYSPKRDLCYPCGACLQVLHEFGEDMDVILKSEQELKTYKLKELLPGGFRL